MDQNDRSYPIGFFLRFFDARAECSVKNPWHANSTQLLSQLADWRCIH
jgi:hypothetical protein